jgi:DNA-binding transcriptional ArsR family regulator
MGLSKSYHFDGEQNRMALLAKAFAHPARIAIIQYLLKNKACIVGTLVDVLPLSQSTISQHLKELKSIGIIKGEIEGPSICYCIDENVWRETKVLFNELFDKYDLEECC